LQQACDAATVDENRMFPRAALSMRGTIEELLFQAPALEVEDLFRYQLKQTRKADSVTGGAATGPHKSDFLVSYAAKAMPASHCSTGEQKALLIGIVLAHARLIAAERGDVPVLLLDEVAAHLDDGRRRGLYDLLVGLGGQVLMTGTDRSLFDALITHNPAIFRIESGVIAPCALPCAA
jgi:DNA replication and repair protein RecF